MVLRDVLRIRNVSAEMITVRLGLGVGGEDEAAVLVDEDDEQQALAFAAEFNQPLHEGSAWTWRCAGCGEVVEQQFDTCWCCGKSRT